MAKVAVQVNEAECQCQLDKDVLAQYSRNPINIPKGHIDIIQSVTQDTTCPSRYFHAREHI